MKPYPPEMKLYLCEFCLKYFNNLIRYCSHKARCDLTYPPGHEVYRSPRPLTSQGSGNPAVVDPVIAVFEVDGKERQRYFSRDSQSLCLLAKLFLDHKTVWWNVEHFLFYVLCEKDEEGYHIAGYFSRDRTSSLGTNLACIMTLPPFQKKGYGRFLMAFSYELSRIDGKVGSPERPLSELGKVGYHSYWQRVLLEAMRKHGSLVSIEQLTKMTYIHQNDIVEALKPLAMVTLVKGQYILSANSKAVEQRLEGFANQRTIEIDRSRLNYPVNLRTTRSQASQLARQLATLTVAPADV
jgi:histone acetyltransferase MYST1